MRLLNVLTTLKKLGQPVLRTADVMACLNINKAHASKLMSRLAETGHVSRIKRGLWVFPDDLDSMILPEYLTAPFPSYISLQSAMYYNGMISQIPEVSYSVSIARTNVYRTAVGTYSIHHVSPDFFFGFDVVGRANVKMASPEKALIDFLYLSTARSGLFRALPELELPKSFSRARALKMIKKIRSARRRTMVLNKYGEITRSNPMRP